MAEENDEKFYIPNEDEITDHIKNINQAACRTCIKAILMARHYISDHITTLFVPDIVWHNNKIIYTSEDIAKPHTCECGIYGYSAILYLFGRYYILRNAGIFPMDTSNCVHKYAGHDFIMPVIGVKWIEDRHIITPRCPNPKNGDKNGHMAYQLSDGQIIALFFDPADQCMVVVNSLGQIVPHKLLKCGADGKFSTSSFSISIEGDQAEFTCLNGGRTKPSTRLEFE